MDPNNLSLKHVAIFESGSGYIILTRRLEMPIGPRLSKYRDIPPGPYEGKDFDKLAELAQKLDEVMELNETKRKG